MAKAAHALKLKRAEPADEDVPRESCTNGSQFVGSAKESHGHPLFAVAFLDGEFVRAAKDLFPPLEPDGPSHLAGSSGGTDSAASRGASAGSGPSGSGAAGGDEVVGYFATAGGRCVTVYALTGEGFHPVQAYTDEDPQEDLYAVRWTIDVTTGAPLLAAAGKRGPIKVLNSARMQAHCVLHGHGDSVNEIRAHPTDPSLILSASKDESLRLWNLLSQCAVAVFAGEKGHASEVLSADFHPLGSCFASAGMDNSIKVWGLDDARTAGAIAASYDYAEESARDDGPGAPTSPLTPALCQFPAFSTDAVHSDYVDSCAFLGNLLLSKSTDSRLLLWCPDVSARLRMLETLAREHRLGAAGEEGAEPAGLNEAAILEAADAWHDPDMGPLLAGETGEAAGLAEDDEEPEEGAATIVAELTLPHTTLWFIRFAVDSAHRQVAAGNDCGDVVVWEPMREGATERVGEEDVEAYLRDGEGGRRDGDDEDGDDDGERSRSSKGSGAASAGRAGGAGSDGAARATHAPAGGDDDTSSSDDEDEPGDRAAFLAAAPLRAVTSAVTRLSHPRCTKPVRQTAFSPDGTRVVAVCDDATVWVYALS